MAIQDVSTQSNRNHAVPQNIMDVEFKIIGDLTMRQFSYLMVLGLFAYFNAQVMVGLFKWPITIVLALLGLALAFVPVQDRGMDVWLVNFIKSVYSPTQMVWRKTSAIPTAFLYDSLNVVKQELITLAPTSSRRKLEEFLDYSKKNLPRDPLDIHEDEYILKVREAFKDVTVQAEAVAAVQIDQTPITATPVSHLLPESAPTQNIVEIKPEQPAPSIPISLAGLVNKIVSADAVSQVKERVAATITPPPMRDLSAPSVIVKSGAIPISRPAPITPDRHSGRRFTSFLPTQGELVLPIRGERVLGSQDQTHVEEDLEAKTEKLQQLLSQIRQSNIKPTKRTESSTATASPTPLTPSVTEVTPLQVSTAPVPAPISEPAASMENISRENQLDVAKVTLEKLSKKRSDLLNEISNLKNTNAVKFADKIQDLQKELQVTNTEYQNLRTQLQDMQKVTTSNPTVASGSTVRDIKEVTASNAPAMNKPDTLWGFVKDPLGKPLPDIVLIIKNSRGEPVRATKTNELGQFLLATPLNSGRYTAEVSASNKTNFTFDVVSLEVSGNVIPPIDLLGR